MFNNPHFPKELKDNLIFYVEPLKIHRGKSENEERKGKKNKRRKGGSENQGAGFINEIIPVSTV
jgi:hypothetical protein